VPNGVPTTYTYDDLGNRWKEDSRDRGVLDYRYDAAGLLTGQTDAARQVRTTYDELNRPIRIRYGKKDEVRFSYGKKGSASGKLVEIRERTGSVRYDYTAFGELASVRQTFKGGPKFSQTYAYDKAGRIGTTTLPGGQKLAYNYDDAGRLAGVMLDNRPILTHMRYSALGMTSATWGNGLKYRASYDALGRITSQTQGKTTVAYAYDKAGNIVRQGDQTYAYDKLDRLIGAAHVPLPDAIKRGDITYRYDANGNRMSATFGNKKTRYIYQPGTNRLASINGTTLKYDEAGNLIEDGRFTFSYNARNRLSKVSDKQGHAIAIYTYNALGLRTSKTVNGTTTYYVYNPNGMLVAEEDEKGNVLKQYVWLGIRPIAVIEGENIYYIHTNHLGTPRVVTDSNGTEVWQWQPTPFGMGKPAGDIPLNLRFPGQYFDTETGLNYNWNRYYDPKAGRYIRHDTIGLKGGMNPFVYVDGNPVDLLDSIGLFTQDQLTYIIYNETSSLRGSGLGVAQLSMAYVLQNRWNAGIKGGIASDKLSMQAAKAIAGGYPPAVKIYNSAAAAAKQALACPNNDPTHGARNYYLDYGQPPPWWASSLNLIESFGPFINSSGGGDVPAGVSVNIRILGR